MSQEVHNAAIEMSTCTHNHIHIRMCSNEDNDCPMLDTPMDPDEARKFACALLEAAGSLSPVS